MAAQTLKGRNKVAERTVTIAFLIASALYLYPFLFEFPFKPYAITEDVMLQVSSGLRLFQGELIYRDFFEFITPGTALVHFFLFKLFGVHYWIPNMLAIALGLGLAWVGIAIARKVLQPNLALLPSAAFLVAARGSLSNPVHHWYSMFLALLAILVLLGGGTVRRIAVAGVLCGLSASFTQTRGLAACIGIVIWLIWDARRQHSENGVLFKRLSIFTVSTVLGFMAVNSYFIWKAGVAQFFWCTVVFVLKYYPKEADWNTFQSFYYSIPTVAFTPQSASYTLQWLFMYVLCPASYLAFFAFYWMKGRKAPQEDWSGKMLIAIVGFTVFLSIAPAPSPSRMAVGTLPPLILMIWMIGQSNRRCRIAFTAAVMVLAILAINSLVNRIPKDAGTISTNLGTFAVTDKKVYSEYTWILAHTHYGEYFYQAAFSDVYFYLGLRNPTSLPRAVNNGYTTKAQVMEAIEQLEYRKPRLILWSDYDPPVVRAWGDPADAHLQQMLDYIHSHYKGVKSFKNESARWEDKVWERTEP